MHWQPLEAVGKQLQAMGCAEYEIAAHDYKAGKVDAKGRPSGVMHIRPASGPNIPPATKGLTECGDAAELDSAARQNSRGCHIFIDHSVRPNSVIGSLSKATVTKMTTEGYQFAALIESSPKLPRLAQEQGVADRRRANHRGPNPLREDSSDETLPQNGTLAVSRASPIRRRNTSTRQ